MRPSNTWRRPLIVIGLIEILMPAKRGLATFFFDFLPEAPRPHSVDRPARGVGGTRTFWVYPSGYFRAPLTVLPVLLVRRFGVRRSVHAPSRDWLSGRLLLRADRAHLWTTDSGAADMKRQP